MKKFFSIEFNKMIDITNDLFSEYYAQNIGTFVKTALSLLNKLRNSEMHFFIDKDTFLLEIEVATILAQLTCYKGSLLQGAPSSPIITNLICNIIDMRLLKIARKYKLDLLDMQMILFFQQMIKNFRVSGKFS